MRVLFLSRSNLTTVPAGDTIQVLNTKRALDALGVHVDFLLKPGDLPAGYDLIHVFNTIPIHEIYPVFSLAKKTGLPLVLSPIYWDAAGWVRETKPTESERSRLKWWEATQELRRQVITGADLLLPNAEAEAQKIKVDFGLAALRYVVVPNAADTSFALGNARAFAKRYKIFGDFIFCSARVDPRKNQLALIEALRETNFPVVFAGKAGDAAYFREFTAKLGPRMTYLGVLSPRELANAYAAAKVHALVSWYDTPGLASLEAALAGCQIVTTDRGSAREYFGQTAFYCNPADPESIRQAVIAAYHAPRTVELKRLVAERYTWEQAGRRTKEAYERVLRS